MRILGLDPGLATVGFGLVEQRGGRLKAIEYGTIETEPGEGMGRRLKRIFDAAEELVLSLRPDCIALEKIYFNRNVTNAFAVGQARGALLLKAEQHQLAVFEYTPLQVKLATVGYGQAEKRQVQEMVRRLLGLRELPRPDDAADALAIALCHANAAPLWSRIEERSGR